MQANLRREQVRKAILEELLEKRPQLRECRQDIEKAFMLLRNSFRKGKKTLVCGNGGSAADSEHIVGELMKGFRLARALPAEQVTRLKGVLADAEPAGWRYLADKLQGALPAISLVSQTSLCSAVQNDVAADMVFAQQVYAYGAKGDVLIGISTSGNAANVINALMVARAFGLATLGLTGRSGGRMGRWCDVAVRAPEDRVHEVQEYHQPIYHALCAMLEVEFFGA